MSVRSKTPSSPVSEAKYIFEKLNQRIIGQNEAKKVLSMAVSVHKHSLGAKKKTKSNVLIMGPTASGKTELIRTLSKVLKVPLAIVDASKLAPTSYKGEESNSIFKQLIYAADGDVEKAQSGIVFLDEIDKISAHGQDDSHLRKIQAELLTILEDKVVKLTLGNAFQEEDLHFDTSGVLFIAAGAFSGLELKKKNKNFGLNQEKELNESELSEVELKQALVNYGMSPELLGRFHMITKTNPLTRADFAKLLDDSAVFSSTEYFINLFKKESIDLKLSPEFKDFVSHQAITLGMGVRGLQGLVENRMVDLLFSIDEFKGKTVSITPNGISVNGEDLQSPRIYSNVLSKTRLSQALDKSLLAIFCKMGVVQNIKKGETLMCEGDPPDALFILVEGGFEVSNSRGLNVMRSEAGTCFGEFGFLHGKKRTATLRATQDSLLLRYENEKLNQLMTKNPELGVKLMRVFSQTAIERVAA